jgi:hypothetical protein
MQTNYDPTDLAGNEQAQRDRAKQQRTEHYLASEDMKWLMGSKRGRRIVWRILERTGIFRSSFTGNSETFFKEGMRNVGLVLMAQINEACPESYTTMVKEQNDHRSNDDASGNT